MTKYGKLFLFFFLSSISQATLATSFQDVRNSFRCSACPAYFKDGYYGGVSIGDSLTNADWKGVNSLSAINDTSNTQAIFRSWKPVGTENKSNLAGRLALGYQLVRCNLYLAAEIGGSYSSSAQLRENLIRSFATNQSAEGSTSQTVSGSAHSSAVATLNGTQLSFDIKPGFLLQRNLLIFARAGLALNSLRLSDSGTWTTTGSGLTAQASGSSSRTNEKIGMRLGLGAEYLFTQCLGLTMDYIYTKFSNIQTISQGSQQTESYVQVYGVNAPVVSLSNQQIMIGLNYHL